MTPADTQAALDAATATLAAGGIPRASLHARDVLALVACVSALRDVLTQTERERDELRSKVAAMIVAYDEGEPIEPVFAALEALRDLAALRGTPAGEGER